MKECYNTLSYLHKQITSGDTGGILNQYAEPSHTELENVLAVNSDLASLTCLALATIGSTISTIEHTCLTPDPIPINLNPPSPLTSPTPPVAHRTSTPSLNFSSPYYSALHNAFLATRNSKKSFTLSRTSSRAQSTTSPTRRHSSIFTQITASLFPPPFQSNSPQNLSNAPETTTDGFITDICMITNATGESHSVFARLDEDEITRDESTPLEMATEIIYMASSTSTTKLTHSNILRLACLASLGARRTPARFPPRGPHPLPQQGELQLWRERPQESVSRR